MACDTHDIFMLLQHCHMQCTACFIYAPLHCYLLAQPPLADICC